MEKRTSQKPIIYQTKSGALELRGDFGEETFWATQAQIAELFEVDRTVITKHIRNILKDAELSEEQVCAKFAHTAFLTFNAICKKCILQFQLCFNPYITEYTEITD